MVRPNNLSAVIKRVLFILLCLYNLHCSAQTEQRIKFTSIISSINTGQDYTPWLNDNVNSLVQDVWQNNFVWVDLKLPLTQHSIITRLSFYDYEGVFTDAPDSIYAVSGKVKTFLGTFTGPAYEVFDGFTLKYSKEADTLVIHKYSNNIPQKVDIYGYPDANHNPPAILSGTADLLKYAVTGAAISPAFSTATLAYTAAVPYTTTAIKLTPTASDGNSTIKVNGITVNSGVTTTNLPLAVGLNTISTVLTSQDGKTIKTYTLKVTRAAASTNNNLSTLTASAGALSPAFTAATLAYTLAVPYAQTSVKFTPAVSDATATIAVNGTAVTTGSASAVLALAVGTNTEKIAVKAQNGAVKTYSIVVTRAAASTNNNLANLTLNSGTLSPAFAPATIAYTSSVGNAVLSAQLVPTVADNTATITINGTAVTSGSASATLALAVGANTEKVAVKAQNGAIKTYSVVITRTSASANNNLAGLTLNSGTLSPVFAPATIAYTSSVSNSVLSVLLTPTVADNTATVTVNGAAVTSGTASGALPLAVGANTISAIVKAQSGLTKTYTVTVTRAAALTLPPPVTPPDTTPIVQIPIDSTRWYILDNVSGGLGGLTNGVLTDNVNPGYGLIIPNYDAYYPVLPGEQIDLYQIKFYSYQGGGLGNYPMTVSVIDSTGTRTVVGTYEGGVYQSWLGPNPGQSGYSLTAPMKNIKYIVLNCWYVFPSEMQLYGHYKAPTALPTLQRKYYPLNQYFGINAFEWNFEDPNSPLVVSPTLLAAVQSFTGFRHYMDWNKLESTQGEYTFNPVHSGGWNYDALYQACQQNNIFVLADLKTLPDWLVATYPADEQDSENVPVPYGSDFSDPNSYLLQAKVAFQYAARYGGNSTVSSSLLSVDTSIRWTNDPENTVKKGMGLVKYIECDNERDKWWKGRKAYQTPYEYAANLSAFYDGNKNTMGPGVGVKNADPTMQVVMGGIASADPAYVHGMVEWCRQNRGYKADGAVNLCWDVINYHLYNNDSYPQGNATTGVAPEVSIAAQRAEAFIQMAHQYCGDMPVWVTESGYDANPGSPQKAPPIGSETAAQVEADWVLRTSLLYARAGVARLFYYEEYDDNAANPTQYASSGLINNDQSRRPAADYLYQVNKVFGKYTFQQTLNSSPIVDRYALDSLTAYMLVMPTQTGKTQSYSLNLNNADSAYIYKPVAGANDMTYTKVKLTNGSLTLDVTETPTFVIPSGIAGGVTSDALALNNLPQQPQPQNGVSLYPNPTTRFTTVALNNTSLGEVTIRVTDVNMGKTYVTATGTKVGADYSQTIDIGSVPKGICVVQIMVGGKQTVKKVIKNGF